MTDQTNSILERLRPAVFTDAEAQAAFRLQLDLAESQWFDRARLEQLQLQRLKSLAAFAARQSPYWQTRLDAGAVAKAATLQDALAKIPILTRTELMANSNAMDAATLPAGHKLLGSLNTSGSTGAVVTIRTTDVAIKVQYALTLRAHLWAGRDFSRCLAIVRRFKRGVAEYPDTLDLRGWDIPLVFPFPTGQCIKINTYSASLEQQWDWLKQKRPDYLLTYPSIVRGQAERAALESGPPTPLQSITTISEVVDGNLREMAADHLKTRLYDLYSSQEAGSMAIQCPSLAAYHTHAEIAIMEVLDEHGDACGPGEIGRVVVTPLFNFATPLFRYEIGDFAEAGAPCGCGRGLPVLNRILGRRRNLLTTPDGRHYWPALGAGHMYKIVNIRGHQFRQTARDVIEVLLITADPITPGQEDELRRIVARGMPAKFDIRIRRVAEIPRPASGKHEEFVSLIA